MKGNWQWHVIAALRGLLVLVAALGLGAGLIDARQAVGLLAVLHPELRRCELSWSNPDLQPGLTR